MATDGTKFRANNSRKHNHNATTAEQELTRIEKRISEYLKALDEADAAEQGGSEPSKEQIRKALKKLKERQETYEGFKTRLEQGKPDAETQISTVDPEARLMKQGGDARSLDVSYNVQTVVDAAHHVIVDFEVTNRSDDHGNLERMSEKAKETRGVERITNRADKGYYDGADRAACEDRGVTVLAAKPAPGGAPKEEGFTRKRFSYDGEQDRYGCPCGQRRGFMRMQKHRNGKDYRVYAHYSACGCGGNRDTCTGGKYRRILRLPYQDKIDAVDKRTRAHKGWYRKRQELVEHPFGTVKAVWGYKQYLCRGMVNVTAESGLAYLAYNLRRVLSIGKGKPENLLTALRA